jgi:tRNA(His) 5'-end guanylyltransferase
MIRSEQLLTPNPEQHKIMWKKIGNRIKALEAANEQTVPTENCFVVRLDGCSFHTFTKGMNRPFDNRIITTMERTTADIVSKFHALTAFCQSDEITLLFPPCDPEKRQTHIYKGRVQKLCSILAAYTSVRFNHHIKAFDWEEKFYSRLDEGAIFDARIMIPNNAQEALDCFSWRHQYDCQRNAVMAVARAHFPAKELHKVSTKGATQLLREKGIDLNDGTISPNALFGTFVKKNLVKKICADHKTGQPVWCVRTETICKSQKEPITIEYLFAKYEA